jgi:hypothetical protein
MALKQRRLIGIITNAILPQTTGAVSFKRMLGRAAISFLENLPVDAEGGDSAHWQPCR